MEKLPDYTDDGALLRKQAEELLEKKAWIPTSQLSEAEMRKLIHELEVYQVELELQNEELRHTGHSPASVTARRYTGLYDLAPTAYFTLSQNGRILEMNLSGAILLGKERVNLQNTLLGDFVTAETTPIFSHFLEMVFNNKTIESCELVLSVNGNQVLNAYFSGIIAESGAECLVNVTDISGLRNTEKAAATLALRYQTLLSTASDGIHVLDEKGNVVEANMAFCAMLGYPLGALLKMNVSDWDMQWSEKELQSRIAEMIVHPAMFETRLRRSDGTILDVEINGSGVTMDGCRYLYASARDITSRKLADDQLAASETRYRRLFESSKDGILILDAESGKIRDVNPFLVDLLGYTREQLVEKEIWEIGLFRDIASNKEKYTELQQREYIRYENLPLETAGGRLIQVEFISSIYLVDNKKVIQCNIRDLSERWQAEEALRESEEKYRFMFAANPQPMWIFDLETLAFLEVNHAAVIHYGYAEKEFLSMTLKDIRPAEDVPELMTFLAQDDHKFKELGEFRHQKKNGEIIVVEITWHAVIFNGRKARHVLINDITSRKQAKNVIAKQNDLLSKITQFSIDIALLSSGDNLELFIARRIKELTGAVGAIYSAYDPESGMLIPRHIELEPGLLKKVTGLLGNRIQKVHSPINEEVYLKITGSVFEKYSSLHEISFGAIPKPVGALISQLLNANRYIGISYLIEGKLYGTSLIALHKNQPDPPDEMLQNIAFLVALSLRRKHAEEALLYEQWRLESIIEGARVGTWEWNVQTGDLVYNAMWAQIIGYTSDELQPVSIKTWEEVTHPDDLAQSNAELRRHFAGDVPYYDVQCRMKHKNGHWIWIHDRGRVITRTTDGKPLMMFGTHTDITEQKLAEARQQEALGRLRLIAARVPGVVYQFRLRPDGTSCFPYASEGIREIYGFSADEIREDASSIFAKIHPVDYPKIVASIQNSARELSSWKQEYRVRLADGTIRSIAGNAVPQAEEDGSVLWHGFITDITERKREEAAATEIHSRLLLAMQIASISWWEMDFVSGALTIDNRKTEMLGYLPGKVRHYTDYLALLHPEDSENVTHAMRRNIDGLSDKYEVEYRILSATGAYLWFYDVGSIVKRDTDGIPVNISGLTLNITVRKQAEQVLVESETRFKNLFGLHSAIMLLIDPETGSIIDANQAAADFYGYGIPDLKSRNIREINMLSDKTLKTELEKAENNRQNYFIFRHRLANGEERTVEVHSSPIAFKGKFILFSIIHDISERMQAEEALRSSRQILEGIINAIPVRVFWKDKNLVYLGCNTVFMKDAGFTDISEIIGKDDYQMGWRNHAELYRSDDRQVIESGIALFDIEEPQTSPEGQDMILLTSKLPLRNADGEINGILGTYMDITGRKKAELALQQSEALYRNLVERLPDGVYKSTPEGKFVEVNPAMVSMLGYENKEELLDIDIPTQLYFKESDRESVIIPGHPEELEVYALKKKDGAAIWVEDHGWYTYDENGKIIFHEGITRDVTGRILAELEINRNTEALRLINVEKDKFFSIIAHDLSGPFNGFMALTKMLAEDLPGMTSDETQKIATLLKVSAFNLSRLLGNLLEWSRMQRGLIAFRPEPLLLMPLVAEILLLATATAAKKDISVIYHIPGDLEVFADRNMLGTIFRNLVSNAVKFTPVGGSIIISAKIIPGKAVEISIQDNGIGMDATLLNNLFRLDVNTGRKGTEGESSTGLGLIICKDFVEKGGGKLWVESVLIDDQHENAPDGLLGGSVFHFTIPSDIAAMPGTKLLAGAGEPVKSAKSGKLKVLIADDDEISLKLLSITVRNLSREILHAQTGTQVIELCHTHSDIDLILMDIKMPEIDGYETTRQIRQFNRKVIIIAQTAYGLKGDREKSMEAGCNDYVLKPVFQENLLGLIRKYFKQT